MNSTKFFLIVVGCGILLLSLAIIYFFLPASSLIMISLTIANLILILIPSSYILRKWSEQQKEEILALKISLTISSVFLTVALVLFYSLGSNLKIFSGEPLHKYLYFILIPLYAVLYSTLVIILTNIETIKRMIKDNKNSLNNVFNSDSYIEMNKSFFGVICLAGILFLFFAYYQILIRRSFVFLTPILIAGQYYDYRRTVKSKIKREFDEREKLLLFKTLSFAAIIFIIILSILYYLKDLMVFGFPVNELWGVLILPVFLLSWGIVGMIIVRNE